MKTLKEITMNFFLRLLFLFLLTSSAHASLCGDAIRDNSMAIGMRNYEMMLQTADAQIQRCGHSAGRAYARIISQKSTANAQLGRYAEGLKNVDLCLSNYPAYPTCLYWKAVIHRDLRQRPQFDRAKKLAIESSNYFINNSSQILESTQAGDERLDLETDIEVARVVLQNLNLLTY